MSKSHPSADAVTDALAAITRAADALFKHTTKATSIDESTTRMTLRLCIFGFSGGSQTGTLPLMGIPPKGIRNQRYSDKVIPKPKVFGYQRYSKMKS